MKKKIKKEDVGTTTANVAVSAKPLGGIVKRKYRQFDVDSPTFNRFSVGRIKFERWSRFLNLQDETHAAIHKYARRNPHAIIVLRDSVTGALRAIRRRHKSGE